MRIADEDPTDDLGSHLRCLERGDLEALDGIYRLAAADVFALALWICGSRDEAAEVVQDVFVKLAARAGGPGGGSPIRSPRAWLLAVARRSTVDRLRRQRPSESAEDLLLEAPAEDPAGRLDAAAASRHLRRLPAPQREAIYLRYFADLSFADVGRVTGVSLFTAASRCRLGLRKLRTWMEVER